MADPIVKYGADARARILEGLAEGKTLRAVCRGEGLPSSTTVLRWTDEDPAFSEQYARARSTGYRLMADEILEISDEAENDVDEDGKAYPEFVARSRLRVDTRKWLLSKALPKIYGDKVDITHAGRIDVARDLSDEALAGIAAGGAHGALPES